MDALILRLVDNLSDFKEERSFTKSPVRIGRNALNDFTVPRGFVSQWHATVEFDLGRTIFRDLGSTNGTQMEGKRLTTEPVIRPASESLSLQIGSLTLSISRGPALRKGRIREAGEAFPGGGPLPPFLPEAAAEDAGTKTASFAMGQVTASLGSLKQQLSEAQDVWNRAFSNLEEALENMSPGDREVALPLLLLRNRQLAEHARFQRLAAKYKCPLPGEVGADHAAGVLLRAMSKYYTPNSPAADSAQSVEELVTRLVVLLESFSNAFIQLRRGQEEFGSEMAVRTVEESSMINNLEDPRELVGYLLGSEDSDRERVQELVASYADVMIHQVALLNGMMEGVRSMLVRIGPSAISRAMGGKPGAGGGLFASRREAANWREYQRRHEELTEEDSSISRALFGEEFARAYASVGVRGPSTENEPT
jgi:type VI secretion system protein ImpI